MSEKIKKDIEEMVNKTTVTREKSILKALGVKGIIDHSYRRLVIYLSDGKEIAMSSELSKKIRACLTNRKNCDFTLEDPREDYTIFRRFVFYFTDEGVSITILEGIRYPIKVESLQPTPNESKISINNPEIVGVICVINKFLELRDHFRAVKEITGREIENFLAQQRKRKMAFIQKLAKKYRIDIDDVLELIKDKIGIADDAFEIMKTEMDIAYTLGLDKK